MEREEIIEVLKSELDEISDRIDPPKDGVEMLKRHHWAKKRNINKGELENSEIKSLIDDALTDPIAFTYISEYLGERVLLGKPLGMEGRAFVYDVLKGRKARPKRQGRNDAATPLRNRMIVRLVKKAIECGCDPTKNDEAKHHDSACDLVAEILRGAGLKPTSYNGVRNIWMKWKDEWPKKTS